MESLDKTYIRNKVRFNFLISCLNSSYVLFELQLCTVRTLFMYCQNSIYVLFELSLYCMNSICVLFGLKQLQLGLGAFLVERSFFPENERNNQERSRRSEKNERSERVLKNFGTISKSTGRNGNCLKRTVKIVNAFLLSRTRSQLGTHLKSGKCFQFRFSLYVVTEIERQNYCK